MWYTRTMKKSFYPLIFFAFLGLMAFLTYKYFVWRDDQVVIVPQAEKTPFISDGNPNSLIIDPEVYNGDCPKGC